MPVGFELSWLKPQTVQCTQTILLSPARRRINIMRLKKNKWLLHARFAVICYVARTFYLRNSGRKRKKLNKSLFMETFGGSQEMRGRTRMGESFHCVVLYVWMFEPWVGVLFFKTE